MSGVPSHVRVEPSFETFVDERSTGLLRLAYLLTGDRGHAEDLLQTALLRTLRHWRRARDAPDAYVRKVLVNLSHDRIRQLRRRPAEAPLLNIDVGGLNTGGPSPQDQVGDRHLMTAALARLPVRQRQVVVLRFYEDLPIAETAELLGCSEGTVKSYTARALARLREVLSEPGREPDRVLTPARRAMSEQKTNLEVRHAH
jgi:RNA polymerase sigma-70 factor (sigma-E family)